jgi:hypothetical protein
MKDPAGQYRGEQRDDNNRVTVNAKRSVVDQTDSSEKNSAPAAPDAEG